MLPPTIDGQTAHIARLERALLEANQITDRLSQELRQSRLQVRELQGRLHSAQVLLGSRNGRNQPEPIDDNPDPMEHLSHD